MPRLLPLVLATALALFLAGCGGGGSPASENGGAPRASSQSGANSTDKEQKGGEASIEEFGSEATGSEREAILAVFTGYLEALAEKSYASACSDLSLAVHESLLQLAAKGSKADCAELLPALLSPTAGSVARRQAEGTVTKVRVKDDRGFVVFEAPGAELYQQTMVREGGEWKTATVAASVLVPELARGTARRSKRQAGEVAAGAQGTVLGQGSRTPPA